MMNRILSILAMMLCAGAVCAETYNVKDFGAKGDGQHIDSPAINAALEKAANEGGGTVVLSEGTYLSYSIHLRSGVTLRIEKDATLKAAAPTATEGYDEAEPAQGEKSVDSPHTPNQIS